MQVFVQLKKKNKIGIPISNTLYITYSSITKALFAGKKLHVCLNSGFHDTDDVASYEYSNPMKH